ncbi:hypothetical protein Lser_V15G45923 [Lactuca serriola]
MSPYRNSTGESDEGVNFTSISAATGVSELQQMWKQRTISPTLLLLMLMGVILLLLLYRSEIQYQMTMENLLADRFQYLVSWKMSLDKRLLPVLDVPDKKIEEPHNDISRSINFVLSAKFEPENQVGSSDTLSSIECNDVPDNIDDVDGIHEIDENFLVELDAVCGFNVNDLASTSNEIEHDPHAYDHVLETKLSADEDSYSKDLG